MQISILRIWTASITTSIDEIVVPGSAITGLLLLFASLFCGQSSLAQEFVAQEKYFQIIRFDAAPVIDGRIGKAEWAGASRVDDLHQVRPVEFSAPSERTVWYVAYDDKSLYVAAHAYDRTPSEISAQKLRQGSGLESDDIMTVLIDPFNNKRSGYTFTLKTMRTILQTYLQKRPPSLAGFRIDRRLHQQHVHTLFLCPIQKNQ